MSAKLDKLNREYTENAGKLVQVELQLELARKALGDLSNSKIKILKEIRKLVEAGKALQATEAPSQVDPASVVPTEAPSEGN